MKRIVKRLTALILVLAMCCSLLQVQAANVEAEGIDEVLAQSTQAAETLNTDGTVTSGEAGPNAKWNYDAATKTLTISGKGATDARARESYPADVQKIVVEKGITEIGTTQENRGEFSYLKNVTSVSLPDSLLIIGPYAFLGTTSLKTITLPKYLSRIDMLAFATSGLTEITIPAYVSVLNDGPFFKCMSLKKIIFEGDLPSATGDNINEGKDLMAFFVAPGAVVYYKQSANGWEGSRKFLLGARYVSSGSDETEQLEFRHLDVPDAPALSSVKVDSNGKVTVKWSAVSGADKYRMEYTTYKGDFTNQYFSPDVDYVETTKTTLSTDQLSKGTYYFRVVAVNKDGDSAPSEVKSVKLTKDPLKANSITINGKKRSAIKLTGSVSKVDLKAKCKGNAKLTYKSNNKKVSVSSKGVVTIKKGFRGNAKITITSAATKTYKKTSVTLTITK